MTVPDRVRFDEQEELDNAALREAAAQRLGEDPTVVVLRPSDEQLRAQGLDPSIEETDRA